MLTQYLFSLFPKQWLYSSKTRIDQMTRFDIANAQSRDSDNIGHIKHRTKGKKTKHNTEN